MNTRSFLKTLALAIAAKFIPFKSKAKACPVAESDWDFLPIQVIYEREDKLFYICPWCYTEHLADFEYARYAYSLNKPVVKDLEKTLSKDMLKLARVRRGDCHLCSLKAVAQRQKENDEWLSKGTLRSGSQPYRALRHTDN
jgi:hypothetical protein